MKILSLASLAILALHKPPPARISGIAGANAAPATVVEDKEGTAEAEGAAPRTERAAAREGTAATVAEGLKFDAVGSLPPVGFEPY